MSQIVNQLTGFLLICQVKKVTFYKMFVLKGQSPVS